MLSAGEGKASELKWEDHGDLVKGEVEAGSKKECSGSGSVSIEGRKMGWSAVAVAVEEGKGGMLELSKGDLMCLLEREMLLLLLRPKKSWPPLNEPPPPSIVGFS